MAMKLEYIYQIRVNPSKYETHSFHERDAFVFEAAFLFVFISIMSDWESNSLYVFLLSPVGLTNFHVSVTSRLLRS